LISSETGHISLSIHFHLATHSERALYIQMRQLEPGVGKGRLEEAQWVALRLFPLLQTTRPGHSEICIDNTVSQLLPGHLCLAQGPGSAFEAQNGGSCMMEVLFSPVLCAPPTAMPPVPYLESQLIGTHCPLFFFLVGV
jgi:hypothetical protein